MVSFVAMWQNLISASPAPIARLESLCGRGFRGLKRTQTDLFYLRHLSVETAKAKVASVLKGALGQVPQNILWIIYNSIIPLSWFQPIIDYCFRRPSVWPAWHYVGRISAVVNLQPYTFCQCIWKRLSTFYGDIQGEFFKSRHSAVCARKVAGWMGTEPNLCKFLRLLFLRPSLAWAISMNINETTHGN